MLGPTPIFPPIFSATEKKNQSIYVEPLKHLLVVVWLDIDNHADLPLAAVAGGAYVFVLGKGWQVPCPNL